MHSSESLVVRQSALVSQERFSPASVLRALSVQAVQCGKVSTSASVNSYVEQSAKRTWFVVSSVVAMSA